MGIVMVVVAHTAQSSMEAQLCRFQRVDAGGGDVVV